ncbi:ATP-binding protein [Desulfallas thermosapovorans]|uniref:IstB-like ATP binding protein n=1 Tax=Desulfallas thermosapovorans DSM 6562 TaxID=1121431 RepID=A0A5S4ZMM8_9FIRM|nr:ATP-binding protein [Desulfallas thermosapovorans]TYO92278.1 IstB-like ATP binding protein [Desulfallas thermosapovorans DSM 6562]
MIQNPDFDHLSFEERFGLLVEQEWTYRQNKRLARLLKQAKLRLPACLEDINYHQPRGLDRGLVRSLGTCRWITMHQNVIITGPTGVGKSYIACALGNAACRQGHYSIHDTTPAPLNPRDCISTSFNIKCSSGESTAPSSSM